jgi:hypothetical protein
MERQRHHIRSRTRVVREHRHNKFVDHPISFHADVLLVRAFRIRCHHEAAVGPIRTHRDVGAIRARADQGTFRQGERLISKQVYVSLDEWQVQEPRHCALHDAWHLEQVTQNRTSSRETIPSQQCTGIWQVMRPQGGLDPSAARRSSVRSCPLPALPHVPSSVELTLVVLKHGRGIEHQRHRRGETWPLFSIPCIMNHWYEWAWTTVALVRTTSPRVRPVEPVHPLDDGEEAPVDPLGTLAAEPLHGFHRSRRSSRGCLFGRSAHRAAAQRLHAVPGDRRERAYATLHLALRSAQRNNASVLNERGADHAHRRP